MVRATADTIRGAADRGNFKTIEVPVERWGGSIVIRESTVDDHLAAVTYYEEHGITDVMVKNVWLLARLILEPDLGDDGPALLMGTPMPIIFDLIASMKEVSGLADDAAFPGGTDDDAGLPADVVASDSAGLGGDDSAGVGDPDDLG